MKPTCSKFARSPSRSADTGPAPTIGAQGSRAAGDGDAVPLPSVRGLVKTFPGRRVLGRAAAPVRAVDGVDLELTPGGLGLVGESGCGKSTTGRMLVRLLEPTAGTAEFEGRDITHLSPRAEAHPAAPPDHLPGSPRLPRPSADRRPDHRRTLAGTGATVRAARDRAAELLDLVGLGPGHLDRHPYQFSGGRARRVSASPAPWPPAPA